MIIGGRSRGKIRLVFHFRLPIACLERFLYHQTSEKSLPPSRKINLPQLSINL
jgi:hypothetical protein